MKSKPAPAPHRGPVYETKWRRWSRRALLALMFLSLLGTVSVAIILAIYSNMARKYDLSQLGKMPERTMVMDSEGELLGRMHGENRIVVPLSQVSPHFIQALLAREDSRFHQHHGIDYIGVLRATLRNLKDGRVVQGASTLTMQLARNSYPDLNDRSFHRKLLEMMLARRIERAWSKDQIIEHYINRIFFGTGVYGIQRASQVYFGKHASQLSLSESAMIAGIIRSPVRFSPFRNFEGAQKERDDVLKRMQLLKMITPEQELQARYADIALRAQPLFQNQGDWALDAVKRDLDRLLESHEIEDGGLLVYTTLNKQLQTFAEEAVEKRLSTVEKLPGYKHQRKAAFDATWNPSTELTTTPYLQGALTMIDNETGGILAMVGGRDYRQSKFNRATLGQRQIGSTVKPFVYAAGLTSGFLPGTYIDDAPIAPMEIEGADPKWSPQNSDGKFLGQQTLTAGLVQSRNTMTIRLGNYAGLGKVQEILRNAGIGDHTSNSPQVFIGNLAGNPREVASAFSVFPNDGLRRRPFLIHKITDKAGNVLYDASVLEVEVLSSGVAHVMRRILNQVMEVGTAASVRSTYAFKEPSGGKTGTTNDYKDAWFAGYTDRVTCAVWVGMDTPTTIIDEGYGSRLSIPIWADVAKKAVELGYIPAGNRSEPPLTSVALCRQSSQLATPSCQAANLAYQDELPYELVPQGFCMGHSGLATAPQKAGAAPRRSQQPRPARGGGLLDRLRSLFR